MASYSLSPRDPELILKDLIYTLNMWSSLCTHVTDMVCTNAFSLAATVKISA